MDFEPASLQRYYEVITDQYHQVYNRYLEEFDDEEEAHYKALEEGYEMITDYKDIEGVNEFVTTYKTPSQVLDIWYGQDPETGKRSYDRGFIRIMRK